MKIPDDEHAHSALAQARASKRLTLSQAASTAGISSQRLLDLLHRGEAPQAILIDDEVRFLESAVEAWRAARLQAPTRKRQRVITQDDLEPSILDVFFASTSNSGGKDVAVSS